MVTSRPAERILHGRLSPFWIRWVPEDPRGAPMEAAAADCRPTAGNVHPPAPSGHLLLQQGLEAPLLLYYRFAMMGEAF